MDALEERVLANLVRLRKAAGLSQRQVEERLELRSGTLYDIEKGRLKLPFVLAAQLVERYHSDLSELLSESGNPEPVALVESVESPLISLGIISGASHPLSSAIAADPVIIAEIGLGQLGQKPLMELLLGRLTEVQQRHFVLDIYRYINSLISADGIIHATELRLRDTLIAQAQVVLTPADKQSIARALKKPFLGKSMAKSLPRDAYRHFLIWTLHLISRSDGKVHYLARNYIAQVAEHIELPVSAFRFIEEQVAFAYHEHN